MIVNNKSLTSALGIYKSDGPFTPSKTLEVGTAIQWADGGLPPVPGCNPVSNIRLTSLAAPLMYFVPPAFAANVGSGLAWGPNPDPKQLKPAPPEIAFPHAFTAFYASANPVSNVQQAELFWAGRLHLNDIMNVDPDTKTVRWLVKTFSADDINEIQLGIDAAPSLSTVTVDNIKAHALTCDPRGSTASLADRNGPNSESLYAMAYTKLAIDVLCTMVGLGGAAIKITSRIGQIARALEEDGAWIGIFERAEQSQFEAIFNNYETATYVDRFKMIHEFVKTFALENLRKLLAVAFDHLDLFDKIFFSAIAGAELVAMFASDGAVTAALGAIEFVVMADILYDDVKAIQALHA